nr:helix-turn-helix domain-containing protein [Streptomyces radicis]
MQRACATRNFGEILRLVNRRTGSSYADIAAAIGKMSSSRVGDIIRGTRGVRGQGVIERICDAFGIPGDMLGVPPRDWERGTLPRAASRSGVEPWLGGFSGSGDDEVEALELARRVQASDVGGETLRRLERAFDELATAYPVTAPRELLERVRTHTAYVGHLLDARATLDEHRRLIVVGGWFSLLGATLHIDLEQPGAARARLATALAAARHADHAEIEAWCYETDAWRVLTAGDHAGAAELAARARSVAPEGSSVAIQATAQEGRARARLGEAQATHRAIDSVQRLAASLELNLPPEHHYQYDPTKSLAWTATTLAWLGDAAAERHAREAVARLGPADDLSRWPRRLASANIDLALALLINDRLDEACDVAQRAVLSGRVVPSNHWRALEVVAAAEHRKLPEARHLREAYEHMRAAAISPR